MKTEKRASAPRRLAERTTTAVPMIDVYAAAGTFRDPHGLAQQLATTLMTIEQVPNIPMFRKNTAAFVHELPAKILSNVDGDSTYVRVQVLTNAGALDRPKQLAVVEQLTDVIASAAGDPSLKERTWVLLTQAPDGGWGLAGHANTNDELVALARAEIAKLKERQSAG
jgi:phenylpyruvate tautomerase PptA (4-oxalocrotonate tautomerase family)